MHSLGDLHIALLSHAQAIKGKNIQGLNLHILPLTGFIGHPSLDLTPGAFSLIQCARVATLVYTTGSRQQSELPITHLLKTPAATYLKTRPERLLDAMPNSFNILNLKLKS